MKKTVISRLNYRSKKKKKKNIKMYIAESRAITMLAYEHLEPSIARGSQFPDSGSSHMYGESRRPDTAFQRYRNMRLTGEFPSEINGRSLSECLDECLRQTSFQCKSALYSERLRTCRLSKSNQKDGHRLIYDADNDYYENLMHHTWDDRGQGYRPDTHHLESNGRPSIVGRPGYPDDYPGGNRFPDNPPYPGNRIPPHYLPGNDYPPPPRRPYYPPRRPNDHYRPNYDEQYPINRIPMDGYPVYDRVPTGEGYPPIGDRLPTEDYPSRPQGGRFPSRHPPPMRPYSRPFPGVIQKYPQTLGPRFPIGSTNYPPGDRYGPEEPPDRYPGADGNRIPERFPIGKYPDRDGYPFDGRYPIYPGKEYPERPTHPGPGPYGPTRPVGGYGSGGIPPVSGNSLGTGGGGAGYDEVGISGGGIAGGGYIGEGGVYHPRPYGNGGGPIIGRPPLLSRCDEQENFRQVSQGTRVRKPFVRRYTSATSLSQCERECTDARDFVCRSFNFRPPPYNAPYGSERDNCELSDRDSRDMDMGNPIYYETGSDYDFYERGNGRQGADECLDVSQTCNEDGMEFTLRTPEGFIGRIYTYGYYDRCFYRGSGQTINVLRISGAQGYPDCGTQRYGDTMTNIVVVQFSDYVQTGRDKRFNLTCLFRGPDEAVVTSGYIGAGRPNAPIPIEYLPAENTLSSKVRLIILYQGRPTTTIAVGDPLTFRLEAQDGYNYATDIFATNVVARDPYSGRSVQLIDRYGCPVDNYVFPGLDRLRDGDSLEARFNAFKIPESNFLVFEATVRTCRDGCQPAFCSSGTGRSEPSYGRRKRSISNDTEIEEDSSNSTSVNATDLSEGNVNGTDTEAKDAEVKEQGEEEFVREMIEVFDSRYDMNEEENEEVNTIAEKRIAPVVDTVCITPNEYYGLMTAIVVLVVLLASIVLLTILIYRKYVYAVIIKNRRADRLSNHSRNSTEDNYSTRANNFSFLRSGLQNPSRSSPIARSLNNMISQRTASSTTLVGIAGTSNSHRLNFDPSEPIYTDPSLFEIPRSTTGEKKNSQNDNFHLM